MTIAPELAKSRKFSGWKSGKTPEKSNFSLTCNLLSQYLREKGAFGDLSLGMACNQGGKGKSDSISRLPTMNLLAGMELSSESSQGMENNSDPKSAYRTVKSMDLFPQHAGFEPTASNQNNEEIPDASNLTLATKPSTAKMTIFYAGKVLVFDDFPADKAQEVMRLASNGGFNDFSPDSTPAKTWTPNVLQPRPQSNCSYLPIARKASLHRFLEKRKDRINAKHPYNISPGTPAKPALVCVDKRPAGQSESSLQPPCKPWLGNGLAWHAMNPLALQLQPFSSAAPER